jgi:hypothetical protein
MNARWEREGVGHVQLANILRSISVDDSDRGRQSKLGWGFNAAGVFNTWHDDSLQAQATYGHGLFRYSNDDFFNNDAGFDHDGKLETIPYLGLMLGYTHHWAERWRSTVSGGYVNIDNTASQAGDAYPPDGLHVGERDLPVPQAALARLRGALRSQGDERRLRWRRRPLTAGSSTRSSD